VRSADFRRPNGAACWLTRLVIRIWVMPNTLVGAVLMIPTLATGGRVQWRDGCCEFYGGFAGWLLARLPPGRGTHAMTLGHTIMGASAVALDDTRPHEHVHVEQYERWGPFFLVAYAAHSVLLWLRGRDPYMDNAFEREAYARDACRAVPVVERRGSDA
jgi:hypothetical protein